MNNTDFVENVHDINCTESINETSGYFSNYEIKENFKIKNTKSGKPVAVLINAGVSKNRRKYPEDVLKNSIHLFENKPMFLNHNSGPFETSRKVEETVAVFKNCRWNESMKSILADVHYLNTEYARKSEEVIRELQECGMEVGLSAVIYANVQIEKEGDSYIVNVKSINDVESIDYVLNPATAGKLLNSIKENNKIVEVNMNELINTNDKNELVVQQNTGETKQETLKENKNDMPECESFNNILIENRLIKFNIDESVRKIVMASIPKTDRYLTQEEVDRFISNKVREIDEIYEQKYKEDMMKLGYPSVRVKEEDNDKLEKAILGMFEGKNIDGVPRLTSLRKLWEMTTGDSNLTGKLEECTKRLDNFVSLACKGKRLQESLTLSDWAVGFGNLMNRSMLKYFERDDMYSVWRDMVRVVPASDFRPKIGVRYGGFEGLKLINELQGYQPLNNPSEESVSYAVDVYGGTMGISWRMIVNDDIGIVAQMPRKFANAAKRKLFKFVMSFLFDNPTIYNDGVLFRNNHPTVNGTVNASNIVEYNSTNRLSYKDLIRARDRMLKFKDINLNEHMGIYPSILVYPIAFAEFVRLVLDNDVVPSTRGSVADNQEAFGANRGFTTDLNFVRTWGLRTVPNVLSDNTTNVFLLADPYEFDGIEIAFLNGMEEPEIFQELPNSGRHFYNDEIVYKIRHVYGGNVMDFRSFVRLQPAS